MSKTQQMLCYYQDRGEFGSFNSQVAGSNRADNARINYAVFRPESGKEDVALVFVTGRTESYLKYVEFIYDVMHTNSHLNYSLYMLDHRGQGFSQRLLISENPAADNGDKIPVASSPANRGGADDPHHGRGFVYEFDDYVVDLKTFVDDVVYADSHLGKVVGIAHSMGGGIMTRYLQKHANDGRFDGVILTSPMNQILALDDGSTGIIDPDEIKKDIVCGATFIGSGWRYTIGGDHWAPGEFATNIVTQSLSRFEFVEYLNLNVPQIRLGAATNRWACKSLGATDQMRKSSEAAKMNVALVLFQSQDDQIVGPVGQNDVCGAAPDCILDIIPNAQHEPIFEKDSIRAPYLSRMIWYIENRF